jgi:hypothetical protein
MYSCCEKACKILKKIKILNPSRQNMDLGRKGKNKIAKKFTKKWNE